MILDCPICRRRKKIHDRRMRTCSYACRNRARSKLRQVDLQPYVAAGTRMVDIARALGVTEATALREVRRRGLYSQWRLTRYWGAWREEGAHHG